MSATPWPPGDNVTDTVFFGIHYNLTTLLHWNYTFYESNWTVSNWTSCHLIDPPYTPPLLLDNGTFVNSTSCYDPTRPDGIRANTGIGFAIGFGIALIFVLINLTRHGKLYLPREKRFFAIGRRWQWYYAILACVFAFIGLTTGIDVDRYRVVELPLVLNCFFWFLMNFSVLAMVWESVRHWGSWMERQFIDPNPFVLHQTDKRGMFEFWLPLFFYFWWWLTFFLIVPRNWGAIELQRSASQTMQKGEPAATDGRFKAAPFTQFICWLTILVSLWHSIRHYEARNRGWYNRLVGFFSYVPFRFVLMIPISLAALAYQELSAWDFNVSPLKAQTNFLAMYLGGYAPALLLVLIQCAAGFLRPNEDKELIRQRRERGNQIDQELGLTKKPAWWRRLDPNYRSGPTDMRDVVLRNVQEVGGGQPTTRSLNQMAERRAADADAAAENNNRNSGGVQTNSYEMSNLRRAGSTRSAATTATAATAPPPYTAAYGGRSEQRRNERTREMVANLLFPNSGDPTPGETRGRGTVASAYPTGATRPAGEPRSHSTASGASGISMTAQPQQIRSMLDV
ncbi:hypothetical protein F5Y16DRAFT_377985 [Xylariaceae sp. FL0255]|nr:hypothetical protein F5Y16DRAFT_377985 [Xylariaceae sp. FL0255]